MRIIVLGGFGFFGKSIVTHLEQKGHKVFPLSRRNGYDLTVYAEIKQAFETLKPEVVYNCAAHVGGLHYVSKRHATIAQDNIQMAINLYQAVEQSTSNALVINPLSNCSYPGEAELYSECDWQSGDVHSSVYSYGNAKRILYMLSRCSAEQFGTRTYNFLVPNAFGPGDSTDPNRVHALNGMIIRMIQAKRAGLREFPIWGTGKPIREWIYVDDVSRLMELALSANILSTQPINFAQKKGLSIKQSAELIAQAVGFKGRLVFQTEYQDGAPKKILDNRLFEQTFSDYQFTDHFVGIEETVAYYESVLPELLMAA